MVEIKIPERYFYHSFPRRGRASENEIAKGCQILKLICDIGLILAPQVVKWQYKHENGAPPRSTETMQRRVCFTELPPHELPEHAKLFGSFALEFDVSVLKALGAIPVFYIPRGMEDEKGAEGAASTLVMQFIDAMIMVERIAETQKALAERGQTEGEFTCTFGFTETGKKLFHLEAKSVSSTLEAIGHALTPPDILLDAMRGMTNFFFPADDDSEALRFYREREWRIAGAMTLHGEDLMGQPGPNLVARLLEIDAEFFGKELPAGSGLSRAQQSFVFTGLGKPLIGSVRRVIVPKTAIPAAEEVLLDIPDKPPVVAIESLLAYAPSQLPYISKPSNRTLPARDGPPMPSLLALARFQCPRS